MPTMDCSILRLAGATETTPRRSTCNTICLAAEGEGRSTIGEKTLNWRKNDVFTIPHWTWASHRSTAERSHLFFCTDRELFRRLHLLRDEAMN